ncbi:MAG: hypothetical protein JKY27_04405 [Magnetovibrio sp.]|nr:hypothetical protein [Magnetovibrio sp.]
MADFEETLGKFDEGLRGEMPPMGSKVVVLRQLTPFTFCVALFLRVFSFTCVVMEPIGAFRSTETMKRLSGLKIFWAQCDQFPGYKTNPYAAISIEYANEIFELAFSQKHFDTLTKLLPFPVESERKLRTLLYDALEKSILVSGHAYALSNYFRQMGYQAYVFVPRMPVHGLIEKYVGVKNLWPFILGNFWGHGIRLGMQVFKILTESLSSNKGHESSADTGTDQYPPLESAACRDVLYFPHKGVGYAKLFSKDQYYDLDTDSPLYEKNIIHVELVNLINPSLLETIKHDYACRDLKAIYVGHHPFGLIERLKKFLSVVKENGVGVLRKSQLSQFILLTNTACAVEFYYKAFSPISEAKVALLGYDYLFPRPACIALQAYGIGVVSSQDRLMMAFMDSGPPLLDLYFVQGELSKRVVLGNLNASVDQTIVAGDPKVRIIKSRQAEGMAERKKRFSNFEKVCIALDCHSQVDPFNNALHIATSWENNTLFYQAIINLAINNPKCMFVIRGKNADWVNIPVFADIVRDIKGLNNVEIDHMHDVNERSYILVGMADVVIARYTSLADQCLADGIPTLFYEPLVSGQKMISCWHDYAPYPVMACSDEDLGIRFTDIIETGHFMDPDLWAEMQRDYYGQVAGKVSDDVNMRSVIKKTYLPETADH